jgi:tripartite-type tricarboxylate transporter receptor subunit TctC
MPTLTRFTRRGALATGAGAWAALAAFSAAPWARRAHAQSDYPNRPVRMILGFAAGGSGDALARILGTKVQQLLGQQLLIENRPGAATNLASEAVARAAPDGYTVLLGGSFSHAVNPALFAKLTFDPVKDFVPVAKVSDGGGQVIVVPSSLQVNTLQEFIAFARREGDKVNYASSGLGSPGHIAGAYFNQRLGLSMVHVPYKGSSEAIRDLASGQIHMTITAPTSATPLVREGRLKALAQTTPARSRFLPDVPGSEEAGLKDFNIDGWYGVFAPAGTPAAVVQKLHGAFMAAMADAEVRAQLDRASLNGAAPQSPEAFGRFVQDEIRRWAPIVKASGASL